MEGKEKREEVRVIAHVEMLETFSFDTVTCVQSYFCPSEGFVTFQTKADGYLHSQCEAEWMSENTFLVVYLARLHLASPWSGFSTCQLCVTPMPEE